MQTCRTCSTVFRSEIHENPFYQELAIPAPLDCTMCRRRQRFSFRNERKLYNRTCSLTGRQIISPYSPDKPYLVYSNDAFWSDEWNATDYGRDFDFSRGFFEQMKELSLVTPWLSNFMTNCTNCDYMSLSIDSQNCYLSARIGEGEDILYSYQAMGSTDCIDCYNIYKCEHCYQCVDCWDCYETFYSQFCRNTNNSWFCYDLIGCADCFGSVGLRHKQYYFFNEKCTKEEYQKRVKELNLGSFLSLESLKKRFSEHLLQFPKRDTYIVNSENVTGDHVIDSKDVLEGYDIENSQSIVSTWAAEYTKDAYDSDFIYRGERCFENISNGRSSNIFFTHGAMNSHDVMYCMNVFNDSHDCFGCISTKRNKYCILNKQYSKEEYVILRDHIIAHMKETGEWGQFFPVDLSCFGYNETVAMEYFPLEHDEAVRSGWKWHDEMETQYSAYQGPRVVIPDHISDVSDDITDKVLTCSQSGRFYKVTPQELKFYRRHGIPIPRIHVDGRHHNRVRSRNPRFLWDRQCAKCTKAIQTTYAPDRPDTVYCESCYREAVY